MRPRLTLVELLTGAALTALVVVPFAIALAQTEYEWRWADAMQYLVRTGDDGGFEAGELVRGLGVTLLISAGALLLALPAGIGLALGRVSANRGLGAWCASYVELVRNSPLLVQIFVVYFFIGELIDGGLEDWSVWRDHRTALLGCGALAAFSAAYIGEIIRGGIESIPAGQMEAARALGLSRRQAMSYVILPQALRVSLPALAGQFVTLVKDSSLLSVIGVMELVKRAQEGIATSYLALELYLLAGALYLVITIPLSRGVRVLELRLARAD